MSYKDEYPQIDLERTGRLLRWLCRQKRIPVKHIQEFLGLASNQAVYDWFNGKTLPTLNNFYALSRLLGEPMERLLVEKGSQISAADFSPCKLRLVERWYAYYEKQEPLLITSGIGDFLVDLSGESVRAPSPSDKSYYHSLIEMSA